jgi:hypothetical protein
VVNEDRFLPPAVAGAERGMFPIAEMLVHFGFKCLLDKLLFERVKQPALIKQRLLFTTFSDQLIDQRLLAFWSLLCSFFYERITMTIYTLYLTDSRIYLLPNRIMFFFDMILCFKYHCNL